MVVLFVIATILLFLSVDFLIQRRKKVGLAAEPVVEKLTLSKMFHLMPAGVFLQPTFTWSKILNSGNLLVGLHPVLLGLVGEPDEIEMLPDNTPVKKGDTLFSIRSKGRLLPVKSPVDGIITDVNQNIAAKEATWQDLSEVWFYTIHPEKVSAEVGAWMIAEKSREWLDEKFQQMKSFFMETVPATQTAGVTMADGGDMPVGVLSQFDEKTWRRFEETFISN
ncbi:MAG: hypothetical protein WAN36_04425 [Calditrichia bacterium]